MPSGAHARSWSSPAASLHHLGLISQDDVPVEAVEAAHELKNPRYHGVCALLHLFPASTSHLFHPSEAAASVRPEKESQKLCAAAEAEAEAAAAAPTSSEPTAEAMTDISAALQAATSQIHLNNMTNAKMLETTKSIELENTRLVEENRSLRHSVALWKQKYERQCEVSAELQKELDMHQQHPSATATSSSHSYART